MTDAPLDNDAMLLKDDVGRPSLAFRGKTADAITEHSLVWREFVALFDESRIDADNAWQSKGLDGALAAKRLIELGRNELTPPKETSELVKFLKKFLNPFTILLIIAGVLALVTYAYAPTEPNKINIYLAVFLFIAVILTCTMSYMQERNTAKVMSSFKAMLPPAATVIRDGSDHAVPTEELVVGDVVRLSAGMKVGVLMCCGCSLSRPEQRVFHLCILQTFL